MAGALAVSLALSLGLLDASAAAAGRLALLNVLVLLDPLSVLAVAAGDIMLVDVADLSDIACRHFCFLSFKRAAVSPQPALRVTFGLLGLL